MTAITDAKLIIETTLGRTVPQTALLRIVSAYAQEDPHKIAAFVDPDNPTNTEMAQLFIDTSAEYLRIHVGNAAVKRGRISAQDQIQTERDTALADLA